MVRSNESFSISYGVCMDGLERSVADGCSLGKHQVSSHRIPSRWVATLSPAKGSVRSSHVSTDP